MFILGLDIGFGDCKVVLGNEAGEIIKKFKFPSMVAITKHLEGVENPNIYEYDGNFYMAGDDAKHLPSENFIDLKDYNNLEYYAPLLIQKSLRDCNIANSDVSLIVTGLSIAQIQNSGYFQNAIESYTVNGNEFKNNIIVLPQGAGAKLTVDKYGNKFPNQQTEFLGSSSYVVCDIGFNTIDLLLVNDGLTDPNLFQGIEHSGIMKIATDVAKLIKEKHNKNLSLQEAKEVLNTGIYKLRGSKTDYTAEIKEIKANYLKEILKIINEKYGNIIDKIDFLIILGGGSYLFANSDDGFIRVVHNNSEFYNAIGEYLYGIKKLNSK